MNWLLLRGSMQTATIKIVKGTGALKRGFMPFKGAQFLLRGPGLIVYLLVTARVLNCIGLRISKRRRENPKKID